jgi:hypothetical protein
MKEPAVPIRDRIRRAERARRDRLHRLVQQAIKVGQALQRLREAQAVGVGADQVLAVVDLVAAEAALAEVVEALEAEAGK